MTKQTDGDVTRTDGGASERQAWTTPVLRRLDASDAELNTRQRTADGPFSTS